MQPEKTFKLDTKTSVWKNFTGNDILVLGLAVIVIFKLGDYVTSDSVMRFIVKIAASYGFYRLYMYLAEILPAHIISNFTLFNSQADRYQAGPDRNYVPAIIPAKAKADDVSPVTPPQRVRLDTPTNAIRKVQV